jgi:hypothetical protein
MLFSPNRTYEHRAINKVLLLAKGSYGVLLFYASTRSFKNWKAVHTQEYCDSITVILYFRGGGN